MWVICVEGYIYFETRRAVNALVHMDQAYEVYKAFCQPAKVFQIEQVTMLAK